MKPEGRSRLRRGRISRRNMFAQARVLQYRLCTRNSSFARGKLLVIVWRSLRRKRLDFLLLASLDCKKLRVLRALRMTCKFFSAAGGVCFREEQAPPLQGLCALRLCGDRRLLRWERAPALRVCAFFVCAAIGVRYGPSRTPVPTGLCAIFSKI